MIALQLVSVVTAVAIIGLTVAQCWMVRRYCRSLDQELMPDDQILEDGDDYLPPAAVIVCLRGNDPSLYQCLVGLAQQEYPDFRLFAVVDHEDDPAIQTLQQVGDQFANAPILVTIEEIAKSRSLKCTALLTAFEAIGRGDFEPDVIALLDSDVHCDAFWLNDLVAPLDAPEVGATTGNRWFQPASCELGAWMRQIWNAAAVVQMHHYNIAWGGSLAFRAALINKEEFILPLTTGFCEDTGINRALEKLSLTLVRVPKLIMTSSESTTINQCVSFITRQNLTAKLYHWSWPLVISHGLLIPLLNFAAISVLLISMLLGFELLHALPVTLLLIFQLVNLYLLKQIADINRKLLRAREQEVTEIFSLPHYLFSVLLIQFAHAWALLVATFHRNFSWRQIEYQVHRGDRVSLLQYQPYMSSKLEDYSIE